MQTVAEILAAVPVFADLDAQELELLAGCARLVRLAEGDYLFREGAVADSFYVVRHGLVAVEMNEPSSITTDARLLEPVGDGGVVGWSWLVPPYRWRFDARADRATDAVHVNAAQLRDLCETEPRLGYHLLRHLARVMHERLFGAQIRLLDIFGPPDHHRL